MILVPSCQQHLILMRYSCRHCQRIYFVELTQAPMAKPGLEAPPLRLRQWSRYSMNPTPTSEGHGPFQWVADSTDSLLGAAPREGLLTLLGAAPYEGLHCRYRLSIGSCSSWGATDSVGSCPSWGVILALLRAAPHEGLLTYMIP